MAEDWYDEAVSGSALASAGGGSGDWYDEAVGLATPPGTVRYAGPINELAARAGRGVLGVPGQVADSVAGVATIADQGIKGIGRFPMPLASDSPATYSGRIGNAMTAMDPNRAASIDARTKINRWQSEIAQLESQKRGTLRPGDPGWDQLGPDQQMAMYQRARQERDNPQNARIDAEINVRRQAIQEAIRMAAQAETALGQASPLSDLAVGAIEVGDEYNAFRDRVLPPSAASADRSWYNPMELAGGALENAPQIGVQTAAALAGGAPGVLGAIGRAGRFAAAGSAFELGDATRSQVEGFRRQGQSTRDAVANAAAPASVVASVNTLLEGLSGLGIFPDRAAKEAARKALTERAMRLGRAAGAEGLTEGLQEGTSAVGEKVSGADPNALDAQRIVPRIGSAMATGAILGGGVGVLSPRGNAGAVGSESGSNNANASGRDPVPNAPARFDPRVAQEAF
ncbi:MAG: hypothetical protein LW822_11135, partial [Phycisphaeraceae bacterium]|nr:hypothetical protein [Phycisphaeraceae bacterium]